ncbi:hypothetical protein CBW65_23225 [Tumebacillus avium]|uniref:Uncharacterized protein n=1 Tax=Tumebacillus avium TaxID=1903704 RepID=A0A1Y0ISK9_9BACL|nr:hypothetical protein [Tumebacillus avium]ARU63598.1 hypothetical protein CBW65_23225 [Tumebacillus avium]
MAVFLFVSIAILVFWGFADKGRFRAMFPVWMSAIFVRFLDHYIVIDWFKLWVLHGQGWRMIWIPMLANITIWPIAAYLYIQYLPKSRNFFRLLLHTLPYVVVMSGYLQILTYLKVFDMQKGWTIWHTFVNLFFYFYMMYGIYRWQTHPVRGGVTNV